MSHLSPSPELMREVAALTEEFRTFLEQARYSDALVCCQRAVAIVPELPACYSDAALCCIHLRRWEEAIGNCKMALRYGPPMIPTLDMLSQAYGCLGQYDEARTWGRMALDMRLELFSNPAAFPHKPDSLPPSPTPQTREHNIIAFSLFGALPKYCEIAILNAQVREQIYPDWTCHFYVDETVPEHVIARLKASGGHVFKVADDVRCWPGPMWRFLAYDTPGLHRVIFRDADSLISTREANAVAAWIESGKLFHHMRDYQTHTELLLAGLWGCTGGALPPMHMLVDTFLREPLISRHFADQFFLRQFVWPYARESLLQHDSMFGFLDPLPFPDGPPPPDSHVGICEAGGHMSFRMEVRDGTRVDWTLIEKQPANREICSYTSYTRDGRLNLDLPATWALAFKAGDMEIRYRVVSSDLTN